MYEIFKSIIETGAYELVDILKKINTNWVTSELTDEQRVELITLAQTNARPENSYAPLQEQIDDLYGQLKKLEDTINANAAGVAALKKAVEEHLSVDVKPEEPTVDTEEYPEYKQPSGAHDAYNIGDKITYDGDRYVCKMNGCVWSPKDYPDGWEKVVEQSTLEEEPIVENVQI